MLPTNLWIEIELRGRLEELFRARKFDYIPSTCDSKDGFLILSMSTEEVGHALSRLSGGVAINATGNMTASIIGTSIVVDVASVHLLEKR